MLKKEQIVELENGELGTVINVEPNEECDLVTYEFGIGGDRIEKKYFGGDEHVSLRRIYNEDIERFVRIRVNSILDKLFDYKCKCDEHGCRCKLITNEEKWKNNPLELFDWLVLYDCKTNNIDQINKIVEAVYEFAHNNFYLVFNKLNKLGIAYDRQTIHKALRMNI